MTHPEKKEFLTRQVQGKMDEMRYVRKKRQIERKKEKKSKEGMDHRFLMNSF